LVLKKRGNLAKPREKPWAEGREPMTGFKPKTPW